ncbi:MAG: hypothetical protein PHS79_00295 [Patescibacteria group bacterium]|nr:hypothetical protein [Patescibacteria group bacterium]
MRKQFETPHDDKADELPPPDAEEEERRDDFNLEGGTGGRSVDKNSDVEHLDMSKLDKTVKYEFDGKTFYLLQDPSDPNDGLMFNETGSVVTTGRRRQVLDEGQAVEKAA